EGQSPAGTKGRVSVEMIFLSVLLVFCMTAAAWGAMTDEDFAGLCKKGSVQEIRNALLKEANINAKDEDGWTALMAAAANNKPEVVSLLLKAGADVNAMDQYGGSALMAAAANNRNPEVISLLLKAGADVNAEIASGLFEGMTVLMVAAANNSNPEVISLLLQAGADVGTTIRSGYFEGGTVMMFAAASGTPEIISLLLEAGADVHAKNKGGMTALDYAREKGNTPVIQLLKEAGRTHAEDSYQLGIKYITGDGVETDEQKGVELLRRAAGLGHPKAKSALKLFE
nr:ankyrin repeat domain-containing protein [Fretibacterium sp.]